MIGLISSSINTFRGFTRVPGDKSISHRALMIGGISVGTTDIHGLLISDDVLHTANALEEMGVNIERKSNFLWQINGVGVGGLREPDKTIDMGNSGTGARLLMGLVATHPIKVHFTGDDSLRERPMERIATPLAQMGTRIIARQNNKMPLTIMGTRMALPIGYSLPVPSAQIKSAILLAGLNVPGETSVIESWPSRDHTELMLQHFGAKVNINDDSKFKRVITLRGQPELEGKKITIPGDPSSAAFLIVAALITQNSEITIHDVCINPLRIGLITTLKEMGANITIGNSRIEAGEPVADLIVRSSKLNGVVVPAERAPTMIDEYPILAIAASNAIGTTCMQGLAELRVKESDRLTAITDGLRACGVNVNTDKDNLIVNGTKKNIKGGATVETRMDHRIAMSFLVLGLNAKNPIAVDDDKHISTSFPSFVSIMNDLGAQIRKVN
tara:strand:+ start:614 stop:1942 length:1329 start_codon:yes stop_codon:yes gene_type:complete